MHAQGHARSRRDEFEQRAPGLPHEGEVEARGEASGPPRPEDAARFIFLGAVEGVEIVGTRTLFGALKKVQTRRIPA